MSVSEGKAFQERENQMQRWDENVFGVPRKNKEAEVTELEWGWIRVIVDMVAEIEARKWKTLHMVIFLCKWWNAIKFLNRESTQSKLCVCVCVCVTDAWAVGCKELKEETS